MDSAQTRPAARRQRLLVEAVGHEIVIYDLDRSVAHALAPLVAAVFTLSDGSRSVASIAGLSAEQLGYPVGPEQVLTAVAELDSLGLLDAGQVPEGEPDGEQVRAGISRRTALKAFAAVGAGALMISSVKAPGALAAGDLVCVLGAPNQAMAADFPNPWGSSFVSNTGGQNVSNFGLVYSTFDNTDIQYLLPGSSLYKGYSPTVTSGNNTGCFYMVGHSNYYWSGGSWQCVPCKAAGSRSAACCQVVCADPALNDTFYNYPPNGYTQYTGSGYYGVYCA